MRDKFTGFALTLLAIAALAQLPLGAQSGRSASPTARPAAGQQAKQKLPPLAYICSMAGDEDVLEDKPGKCPKCGMALVPVRLDAKFWCPVHQALEVQDGPGTCRRDGRELVPVTLSVSWTCASEPDNKLLEPGKCADGSPRKLGYELRAHGDHNPRHGGQFFMATDGWHHIEGSYPENGIFRVFFYDNFTKPLAIRGKGFSGSVVIRDKADKEIATVPLVAGRNTSTMEAKIPAAAAALPLRVTAKMKFGAKIAEQPFDFTFAEYSKDAAPAGPTGPTSTQPTKTVAPAPKPAAAPAVAAAAPTPPAAPTVATAAPTAPAPAAATTQASDTPVARTAPNADLYAGEIAPMPPALAAVLDESVLPKTVPELLKELAARTDQVNSLVRDGNLSEVWLPAMGTKTVALVLEAHVNELPAAKRPIVTSAVKRIVAAAWDIDGYGDLGNKTKIVEAHERFSSAIAELKAVYEGSR